VIDEKPSDPPHCSPTVMWLAGTRVRVTRFASGNISLIAAMPASMVLRVPPVSCITNPRRRSLSVSFWSWNNIES
jgi:hypothetical protein